MALAWVSNRSYQQYTVPAKFALPHVYVNHSVRTWSEICLPPFPSLGIELRQRMIAVFCFSICCLSRERKFHFLNHTNLGPALLTNRYFWVSKHYLKQNNINAIHATPPPTRTLYTSPPFGELISFCWENSCKGNP